MVAYRRHPVPGGTYFFTVTLTDRRATTLTTHITSLRAAFRKARAERPFAIDAIVVLPDHLHAILTLPENDADFATRWRRIKTIFTQDLRAQGITTPSRDKTGATLWQRRFWDHAIRNTDDFKHHVDYIHYNPVKHALVTSPQAWPHSSLHRYITNGILPTGWAATPTTHPQPSTKPPIPA